MSLTRPLTRLGAAVVAVCAGALAPAAPALAAPQTVRTASTARCTKAVEQTPNTSVKHEITNGGRTRTYILRLPDGYDHRRAWPLIVAFHGRGSTGAEIEGYSKLSQLPAVVAYPDGEVGTGDGYRRAWEGAPYAAKGVDDVAFTRDLVDHLQGSLCVDPARTYATGKSNGGGFAALLACRMPDRFAAVAPVATALYPGTSTGCVKGRHVPVIDVHGTGDTTIPYAGDSARGLPPVGRRVSEWAAANGCRPTPRVTRTARDVTTYRYRGCAAPIEHVAVTNGGHVWPGADVFSGGSGYTTQSIETHEAIWRFFSRARLDQEGTR